MFTLSELDSVSVNEPKKLTCHVKVHDINNNNEQNQ